MLAEKYRDVAVSISRFSSLSDGCVILPTVTR